MSLKRVTLYILFAYEFEDGLDITITSSCGDTWIFDLWSRTLRLISRADGMYEPIEVFYYDVGQATIRYVMCHVGVEQHFPLYNSNTELSYYVRNDAEKTLSNDLMKYTDKKLDGDVSFVTKEGTILKSYSIILKARSATFRRMFRSGLREAESMQVDFTKYPMSLVSDFLHFFTHDRVLNMEENACDLLILGDMYQLDKLKKDCEYFLAHRINEQNAAVIAQLADQVNSNILSLALKGPPEIVSNLSWPEDEFA